MQSPLRQRRLRRIRRRATIFFTTVLVAVLLFAGIILLRHVSATYGLSPAMVAAIITRNSAFLKQSSGRTNFLILGVGGEGHDGGDLTDTLMVLSLNSQARQSVLISLPRDIWIPDLKDKINSAYHYGEQARRGGGLVLAKATVEEVMGIPVHYALLIDFSGFTRLIDLVGGVDVKVAETFTDNKYPIAGKETDECGGDPEYKCRYETVTFTQGVEHMKGQRALIYVRSRHAEGEAGTDFSRGRRQQAVIVAFKNKLLQLETLTNWKLLLQLRSVAREVIVTDMTPGEMLLLGRIAGPTLQLVHTAALTLDEPDKHKPGLLINPPTSNYGGKWVLVPKSGDLNQIHKYITCLVMQKLDCDKFTE